MASQPPLSTTAASLHVPPLSRYIKMTVPGAPINLFRLTVKPKLAVLQRLKRDWVAMTQSLMNKSLAVGCGFVISRPVGVLCGSACMEVSAHVLVLTWTHESVFYLFYLLWCKSLSSHSNYAACLRIIKLWMLKAQLCNCIQANHHQRCHFDIETLPALLLNWL